MTKAKSDPQHKNIYAALLAIQSEVDNITRDKTGYHRNKYATEEQIKETLNPLFNKHGVFHSVKSTVRPLQRDFIGPVVCEVYLRLFHAETETEHCIHHHFMVNPEKLNEQGCGGAITYGTRYCYLKGLGLIQEDPNDAELHQGGNYTRQQQTTKKYPNPETAALSSQLMGMYNKLNWSQATFYEKTGYQSFSEIKTADQYQDCIDKLKPWIIDQGAA